MKVVIFDFDGTLSIKRTNLWKSIWVELGYDIGVGSYYRELFKQFMEGKITHPQWCDLTCQAFQKGGLNKKIFDKLVANTSLIDGDEELIKKLHSSGIEMHIVSGNIVDAIKRVLGENAKYITAINANNLVFNQDGTLDKIVGTKYDFEGKATYIKELCNKKGYKKEDILFVGNSMNDEWVYQSGAKTLCVNPDDTQSDNVNIWNKTIYTDNLIEIEKEI